MTETLKLSRSTAAFGWSAAVTILFNTALACVKDACQPLSRFMASLTGHNWTTQGIADIILFFGLGLLFLKTGWAETIAPRSLISFLVASVVIAGIGLAAWYALF